MAAESSALASLRAPTTWRAGGDHAPSAAAAAAVAKFLDDPAQTKVDLSNLDLAELPEAIGLLGPRLRKLDCYNNQLSSLPDSVGELAGLRRLMCFANKLTTLPDTLGALQELRELVCHSNPLTTLPIGLGWCKALRALSCLGCPLEPRLARLMREPFVAEYGDESDDESDDEDDEDVGDDESDVGDGVQTNVEYDEDGNEREDGDEHQGPLLDQLRADALSDDRQVKAARG